MHHFEIIGEIRDIEMIATGHGIRDLPLLLKHFGGSNWRKLKGFGIGKRWIKIKRYLS